MHHDMYVTLQEEGSEEAGTSAPAPKMLRSARPLADTSLTGKPVLPPVCVICSKPKKQIRVKSKWTYDKLSQAQTVTAGSYRYIVVPYSNLLVSQHNSTMYSSSVRNIDGDCAIRRQTRSSSRGKT